MDLAGIESSRPQFSVSAFPRKAYTLLDSRIYSFISYLLNTLRIRNVLGMKIKNGLCLKELICPWEGRTNNQVILLQCDPGAVKTCRRLQIFLRWSVFYSLWRRLSRYFLVWAAYLQTIIDTELFIQTMSSITFFFIFAYSYRWKMFILFNFSIKG